MLTLLLSFAWLTAWAAPETRIGAALHRWTIAAPARWLNRVSRAQVLMALGIALLLLGAAWLGHDALLVVARGSPELIGALGSVELTVWIDALAGLALTWTMARWTGVVRRILPRRAASRARRPRQARPRKPAANDDDDRRVSRAA